MAKTEEDKLIGAIYKGMGEQDCNQDVTDWLSTGFLPLNKAISGYGTFI
jgi:hypothetical protein